MCVFGWNFVEGLCVEIYGFNVWFCWNKYGDECEIENRNILIFVDIDVAGGAVGIEPSSRPEQPRSRPGRWITPLLYTAPKKYFKISYYLDALELLLDGLMFKCGTNDWLASANGIQKDGQDKIMISFG